MPALSLRRGLLPLLALAGLAGCSSTALLPGHHNDPGRGEVYANTQPADVLALLPGILREQRLEVLVADAETGYVMAVERHATLFASNLSQSVVVQVSAVAEQPPRTRVTVYSFTHYSGDFRDFVAVDWAPRVFTALDQRLRSGGVAVDDGAQP